jgi:hypothetical protein
MDNTKKIIGYVGVDSGQILITDPCYIDDEWVNNSFNADDDHKETKEYSYDSCCKATLSKGYGQLKYKLGHDGVGVVSTSGYGDGNYPVIATFNKENRIIKIEILFED